MKIFNYIILMFPFLLGSCNVYISDNDVIETQNLGTIEVSNLVNEPKRTLTTKFNTPSGFTRVNPTTPFAVYLNHISLKGQNGTVKLYDGTDKLNRNSYVGVLDLQPFTNNVQFHTNAIFRLRAEFLYHNKRYDEIDFKISNKLSYVSYSKYANGDFSYAKLLEYMDKFLTATSTNSLSHITSPIKLKDITIGDVFMQKSSTKSHAVIVMDMAVNNKGEKIMLLAQSYYPGQDIQILANPSDENLSPWYKVKEGNLLTPEWRFISSDLVRFN
ncbi:MAG: hypothetical protein KIG88_09330 [Weeksellaceae bacterium]|nr:hypothetical protein [Weeksellaceae bacterium]